MNSSTQDNVLHVYGQRRQHDEVIICGDEKSLAALCEAIQRVVTVPADAAGERVEVNTDHDAVPTDAEGVRPWTLLKGDQ